MTDDAFIYRLWEYENGLDGADSHESVFFFDWASAYENGSMSKTDIISAMTRRYRGHNDFIITELSKL